MPRHACNRIECSHKSGGGCRARTRTPEAKGALCTMLRGHNPQMSSVYTPGTVADVREVVRQARAAGRRLRVVSTDRNWGYRFPGPPPDGADLLHLGRLNRVRNADAISPSNPVALIEAGVTQGQLHDLITERGWPLFLNVTGSARDTSIIGNAMDAGIGYFGSRRDELYGLEVVLPDGGVLHTGLRRLGDDSPVALLSRHGVGPSLDGLFFQPYGQEQDVPAVVTSACLPLRHRPPLQASLTLSLLRGAKLPDFIDRLALLRRRELVTSVMHVGNRARSTSTLAPGLRRRLQALGTPADRLDAEVQTTLAWLTPSAWSAVAGIGGSAGQVRETAREVVRVMAGVARTALMTDARLDGAARWLAAPARLLPRARRALALVETIRPLHGLAKGVPSDAPVQSLLDDRAPGRTPCVPDVDATDIGIVYVSPILPLEGQAAAVGVQALLEVIERHGFTPYMTLNVVSGQELVAITNLLFDRSNPDQTARALDCLAACHATIEARGLEVYRCHQAMVSQLVSRHPGHWQRIRSITNELAAVSEYLTLATAGRA